MTWRRTNIAGELSRAGARVSRDGCIDGAARISSESTADMIVMGTVLSSTTKTTNLQQGVQAGIAVAKAHARLLLGVRLGILVLALLIAVIGTWKGVLPGTKRSTAQKGSDG